MARSYGLTIDQMIGLVRSHVGDLAPRRFSDGQIIRALNDSLSDFLRSTRRFKTSVDMYTHPSGASWQAPVLDKDTLTPPANPSWGDRYLIDGTGAGGWVGKDYQIAEYSTSWSYTSPTEHMAVYVEDEAKPYIYDTTAYWQALTDEDTSPTAEYELPYTALQIDHLVYDVGGLDLFVPPVVRRAIHEIGAYTQTSGTPQEMARTPTGFELYPPPADNGTKMRVYFWLTSVYTLDTQLAGTQKPTDYSLRLFNRSETPHTVCPPAYHNVITLGAAAYLLEGEGEMRRGEYWRRRFETELTRVRGDASAPGPRSVRTRFGAMG